MRKEIEQLIKEVKPVRAAQNVQFSTSFYEYKLEPVDGHFAYLYVPERTLKKLKEGKKHGKIRKIV
jgi:hypothetical protein